MNLAESADNGSGSDASATQKRPLDDISDSAAKRQQFNPADIDLEALASQLNQHTAGHHAPEDATGLSLEEQLEGVLASLQGGQHEDSAHQAPVERGTRSAPGQRAHDISALQLPHSQQYVQLLESQIDGKVESVQADNATLSAARQRCFPILDSLAGQILDMLSGTHYQEVLNIVTQPDTDKGMVYRQLVDMFEQTKKLYTVSGPFIPYTVPGCKEYHENHTTIQRANLATFCGAVFGPIKVGFWELNKAFVSAFVPENGRILKSQTPIYLDLKTQAYISAFSQTERPRAEVLDELFPSNLAAQLANSRHERTELSPSESDFVARCAKRRENIEKDDDQVELAKRYQWVFFLRDLSDYIGKHYHTLIPAAMIRPTLTTQSGRAPSPQLRSSSAQAQSSQKEDKTKRTTRRELGDEAKAKAAENDGKLGDGNTLALYEAAKASSEAQEQMRPGKTSIFTRRTWTKEEEEALLRGLDRVQGPYWSQILELYGPGGSVSEVLKDRTQVQLKDKARNLKMFFVRCNLPIPAVFQYVTGDYETRKTSGKRARDKRKSEETVPSRAAVPHPHAQAPSRQNPAPVQAGANPGDMPQLTDMSDLRSKSVGASSESGGDKPPVLDDEQLQTQTADALDKALSMLKENEADENHLQHLIQSVGEYINNQS